MSDRDWLMKNQNIEARAHMKDLLAQAVVQKGTKNSENLKLKHF